MPIARILPGGIRLYTPRPQESTHRRAKRGKCAGWSFRVARSFTTFLQSIMPARFCGRMYAVTLTVRDCPASPDQFNKARRRFVEALRYRGFEAFIWCTEWQLRKVPHLHCLLVLPEDSPLDELQIKVLWLMAARDFRPAIQSQDCRLVDKVGGWFQYLGKHAARSISNLQRSSKLIPPAWAGVTGRMWGYSGEIPRDAEGRPYEIPHAVWWQLRRLILRFQIATARTQRDIRRVRYLRRFLKSQDRERSPATSLPSWLWLDDQWSELLLYSAHSTHLEKVS